MRARESRLRPERALSHPSVLVALVVLGANDHLLKGSGLLPGALTGKLSDLAGLYAAPALFATVLRAKSPHTVLVCHAAVGAVFGLLELCPWAAELWGQLFTLVGLSFRGTADPSDLFALPMVALAYLVLVPRMARNDAPSIASSSPPSRVELGALGAGLVLCLATSPSWAPRYVENGSVLGDAFVLVEGNSLSVDVALPAAPLDCERLRRDPRGALAEVEFKPAWGGYVASEQPQPVRHEPRLDDVRGKPCTAVRVSAHESTWFGIGSDELAPTIVAWETAKLPLRPLPDRMKASENPGPGALILRHGQGDVRLTALGPFVVLGESSLR